jgi:flagellar protein FlbD
MINVHRLNGTETFINADIIESVESHGTETVLALTTGNKIVVRESVTEVVQKAMEYKRAVLAERSSLCL